MYEQDNERDKKQIVAKIEDDMLILSNHMKNKIARLNSDFET